MQSYMKIFVSPAFYSISTIIWMRRNSTWRGSMLMLNLTKKSTCFLSIISFIGICLSGGKSHSITLWLDIMIEWKIMTIKRSSGFWRKNKTFQLPLIRAFHRFRILNSQLKNQDTRWCWGNWIILTTSLLFWWIYVIKLEKLWEELKEELFLRGIFNVLIENLKILSKDRIKGKKKQIRPGKDLLVSRKLNLTLNFKQKMIKCR